MRRSGLLTTDADLVVRSWDDALSAMTGIPAATAVGSPLATLAPEAEQRGVLALFADAMRADSSTVLAPAIHHFLFRCAPAEPSADFADMQQRVVASPLANDGGVVGLAISIEDVTARLEGERRLARALQNPDPAARRAAIEAFSASDVPGVGALQPALRDDDWQVRRAAVGAVASRPDPALLDAVVAALRDGHHDFSLLSSAIRLLSLTGIDAAEALIALLRTGEIDVRVQAALGLGMQSGPAVTDALLSALNDPDRNVRFHVIEALGRLGAHEAVGALSSLAAEGDFFLAFPAIESLVRIGDPAAAGAIVPRLADPELRDAAADALGALGDEDVVGALIAQLADRPTPVGPVVSALTAIHARYEETPGGSGRIEDLVRRFVTPDMASAIVGFVRGAGGVELRSALVVLSWIGTKEVAAELTRLLGEVAVPHDAIETLVRFGSPVIDLLVGQLQRGDLDTQRAAAVALGRLGDRAAVPALIDVLERTDDAHLLVPVAGALARIGDGRAFEPLLGRLGHADPTVRQAAVGALNSIGHPEMAGRIATLLHHDDPNVRQSAVKIAGYFGYPQCAEALVRAAGDRDERVRAAALEHLAYLDESAVLPVLTLALMHETPRCRAAAAVALGHVADQAASDALLRALTDGDPWVRYFAIGSLGRQRDPRALDTLDRIATSDEAGHVRIAAVDAIGAIGGNRAAESLEPLTTSRDTELATAALRTIGGVRAGSVLGVLQQTLRSEDPRRRVAAVQGLSAHGGVEAIDALRWTASADQDDAVVAAAIDGLAGLVSRYGDATSAAVEALATVAADPARRQRVLPVLASIPPNAVPALGAALHHSDTAVRLVATEALGRIGRPPASDLLIEALEDHNPEVRARAVSALARLGSRGAARRLARLARTDESAAVRRVAAVALSRSGGADAHGRP